KELYDKVQVRLKYNYECWRNSRRPHLLSNLVWCEKCDKRCYTHHRNYQIERKCDATRYERGVYVCKSKSSAGHIPEINAHVLESCVETMTQEVLLNPEKLISCVDILKRTKRANGIKIDKQLGEIEEKIKSIAEQKKRLLDLYTAGDLEHSEYSK